MDRFLDESVLADFTALRMTAFGKTVIDIANDPAFDTWTFSQKVLYALDKEVAAITIVRCAWMESSLR